MKKVLFTLIVSFFVLAATAQRHDTTIYEGCRLASDSQDVVGGKVRPIFDSCPQFGKKPDDYEKYMATHLRHHGIGKKDRHRIIISIVIEKNGSISNAKIIRPVSSNILNKEALRIIKAMPKWKPAILHGKPVRTKYFLVAEV